MKPVTVLGLGLIVLLGGAYTGYWFFVADKLQAGIENWVAEQRSQGNNVTIADGDIEGFPFSFRRDFGAAELNLHNAVPFQVKAQSAIAEIKPWNLNTVIVEIRDMSLGSTTNIYQADLVEGSLDIPETTPADYHQPFLGFDLAAKNVTLPPSQHALTDKPIETVSGQGSVMGPVPIASDMKAVLAAWASAGGVLELKNFSFVQAPLDVAGDGTLALDETLQPLGALTFRAYGVAETVELLAQAGLIDESNARTAKLTAQNLAKVDETGRPRVDLSLSVQQGYVWLGPVKLAPLPPLAW